MKRITFFFALICALYTQAQSVSNVRAMQQDTTLVIVYDLRNTATTKLQVSFDGGNTFTPAQSVTGDIGYTNAGNNRIVYWNATKDAGYFDCDKMVFKIIATGRNLDENIATTAVPGTALTYDHRRVYQNGSDITREYKGFLRNNCPEAYRSYKRKWHGMFWGGMFTTLCSVPFCLGGILCIAGGESDVFGMATCFAFMSTSFISGITIMSCSTITARRHSVKVYNNKCGLLDNTSWQSPATSEKPIQLSLGTSNQGIGMALHF